MRIRQEILLGIGGLRALEALGIKPTVYHMNEGHSAFLALERVARLMETERLSYEEARVGGVLRHCVYDAHASARRPRLFSTRLDGPLLL